MWRETKRWVRFTIYLHVLLNKWFMKYLRPFAVLLLATILAYGLLIPRLGFYWDDLPITWIRYQLGPEALTRYFSTNRPLWGALHQVTTQLIPQVPVYWQVFALFWRWVCAMVVYAIVDRLWQGRPRWALGIALLFLVYPGFNQHWTAYLYSHFYIVLFFFLFSLLCMLLAFESPNRYWIWTVPGLFLSALNLWMMEYFYVLELTRVGVIVMILRNEPMELRTRLIRIMKMWMPYLSVFLLAVFSRLFIFNNQTYGISLADQLNSAPAETLGALIQSIGLSLKLVLKNAWVHVFDLREMPIESSWLNGYYLVVLMTAFVVTTGFLLLPRSDNRPPRGNLRDVFWMAGLGALAVFLAGWPFWMIGFKPSLEWPASRFVLPFLLGASLLFGGIARMIPWERLQTILLVSMISLAAGKQYLTSLDYARDWEIQKELFWQMTWRAPGIQPDTLVLLNEGVLHYYADNSLSAALNWIYAPDAGSDHIPYALFHPRSRLGGSLPKLEAGLSIRYNYLAGDFEGSTSRALAMYFSPPGCLRVLDPDIERTNRLIPEPSFMRIAARISDPGLILNEPFAQMPKVYGPEPEHDYCYYFEKADLARQFGDWATVLQMTELALSFDMHPYDPAEYFVFIEGYAHAGEWSRAVELSQRAYAFSTELGRPLCRLWTRIKTETTDSVKRSEVLSEVESMFLCSSE